MLAFGRQGASIVGGPLQDRSFGLAAENHGALGGSPLVAVTDVSSGRTPGDGRGRALRYADRRAREQRGHRGPTAGARHRLQWEETIAINLSGPSTANTSRVDDRAGAGQHRQHLVGGGASATPCGRPMRRRSGDDRPQPRSQPAPPHSIRVNAVLPGPIRGAYRSGHRRPRQGGGKSVGGTAVVVKTSLRRMPTSGGRRAVLFLASDAASEITGQAVTVRRFGMQ